MDDWVDRLSHAGPEQNAALLELGKLLKGWLARAFAREAKVDEAFVDDAVQDALTSILGSLHQFEGKSLFTTWATTLAVRKALREMRRLRWKDVSLDELMANRSSAVERADTRATPAAKAFSKQLLATMYQIIDKELTDKQREVLLAHLRGMPQAEIGRRMQMTRNAVYKLGFDARRRLKEKLIAAGYSAEDLEIFEAAQ